MGVPISTTINGKTYEDQVESRTLLVNYLRMNCG